MGKFLFFCLFSGFFFVDGVKKQTKSQRKVFLSRELFWGQMTYKVT